MDQKRDTGRKTRKYGESRAGKFKPNKEVLREIKELLTYRMIAQRYPYEELKKDILLSKEQSFRCYDLEAMFKAEPFYLTPAYAKVFLEYVFEKKDSKPEERTSTETLLKKIRSVIKDFELMDEKEEEDRLMSIAEITTQNPDDLESAFDKIKNGQDTVAKTDMVNMFKKLEVADHFIETIISELSLCSEDLQHLSIRGYF
jgi:hypothetical protein